MHKEWTLLRSNLVLAAIGGSFPSTLIKGNGEESPIYSPFPYNSDQDFKRDLDNLNLEI